MKILHKQGWHLLSAVLLAGLVWAAARGNALSGSFWGLSTGTWLVLAVLFPVLHQLYVVVCWRGELYYGWLSKALGEKAFTAWGVGFMILFLARPLTVLALGIANQGSLPVPPWLNIPLIAICLGVTAYMAYSFVKYFGVERALGMDHFEPQRYQGQPLVREGIFAWSANAMYTYAFLALWMIGLIFQSEAALLAAGYNHLFVWAHYFFTEYPDMQTIYGVDPPSGN